MRLITNGRLTCRARINLYKLIGYITMILSISCLPAMAASFVHPGCTHTLSDLENYKTKVLAGKHPWIDGWNLLINDHYSGAWNNAVPSPTIGGSPIRQRASLDASMAYMNTIRYYVSGDTAHLNCAMRILDAWTDSIKTEVTGELFQLPIWSMVDAAELLRGVYPQWPGLERFKAMCLNYFYPPCKKARGSTPWIGWDAPYNVCCLEIAVLCDDQEKYDDAMNYFKSGSGAGCITNAILPSGQVTEMGRDQPHAEIGPNALADFCQIALNQGTDLYSYGDNRLLKGFEYFRKYNLNHPVNDWVTVTDQNFYYPSKLWGFRIYASGERVFNYYTVRKNLTMPYTEAMLKLAGIKEMTGLFIYTDSTALYSALPMPGAPEGLRTVAGCNRVELYWTAPPGDIVSGYQIVRVDGNGISSTIASWTNNTSTEYVDTNVIAGNNYTYKVAAQNSTGVSAFSATSTASPVTSGTELPQNWTLKDIGSIPSAGTVTYSKINGGTFILSASGNDIWGNDAFTFVNMPVSGDFVISARVYSMLQSSSAKPKAGLMIRESFDPNAAYATMYLGGTQSRIATLAVRDTFNAKITYSNGNSHSWVPVWLKLQRVGNVVSGYQSQDGSRWFEIGIDTVKMTRNCYVGLFVCRIRDNDSSATVQFDTVVQSPVTSVSGELSSKHDNNLGDVITKSSSTKITIAFSTRISGVMELQTISGRQLTILQFAGKKCEIDRRCIARGVYVLKVTAGQKMITRKIVLQ